MKKLLFSFVIVLTLFSCKNHETHDKHWSYQGETAPEHWAEIEKNSSCDGNKQSPINIIDKDAQLSTQNSLEFHYSPSTVLKMVENNGHSIQFDFDAGDSITYNNKSYHLKQIHFHEPAEHLINGVKYPIEIHLVHLNSAKEITVLGILGMEGEESQLFEFFESFLPIQEGHTKDINQNIDLASLFPEDKSFYSYSESLTTPPCTEGVNWVVFKNPIIISLDEVLKLKNNMPLNNYRNEQALNGRTVLLNQN